MVPQKYREAAQRLPDRASYRRRATSGKRVCTLTPALAPSPRKLSIGPHPPPALPLPHRPPQPGAPTPTLPFGMPHGTRDTARSQLVVARGHNLAVPTTRRTPRCIDRPEPLLPTPYQRTRPCRLNPNTNTAALCKYNAQPRTYLPGRPGQLVPCHSPPSFSRDPQRLSSISKPHPHANL